MSADELVALFVGFLVGALLIGFFWWSTCLELHCTRTALTRARRSVITERNRADAATREAQHERRRADRQCCRADALAATLRREYDRGRADRTGASARPRRQ